LVLRRNVRAQQRCCRHLRPIELFTDAKMPARKALDDLNSTVKATNRPPSIWIIVKPEKRDRFTAWLQGEQTPLCVSRQPFLDGARKLLDGGHDPRTILIMRHAGSDDVALRGWSAAAAKLTVDEHNGTVFAKWKPFRRSAGSARIENPAGELSERPRLTTARRKRGPPSEGDQQAPATQTNQARMKHARR
jgi:hypothetical protein